MFSTFKVTVSKVPSTVASATAGLLDIIESLQDVVAENRAEELRQAELLRAANMAVIAAHDEADQAAKVLKNLEALLA